jgi:hypothetical protein
MLEYLRLAIWTIIWVVGWPLTLPFRKKGEHNCLTWALRQMEKKDGYLVIRWCRSAKYDWLRWPHFLFLQAKHHEDLIHLVPKKNEHEKKTIPSPWFDGYIKIGDNPEDEWHEN